MSRRRSREAAQHTDLYDDGDDDSDDGFGGEMLTLTQIVTTREKAMAPSRPQRPPGAKGCGGRGAARRGPSLGAKFDASESLARIKTAIVQLPILRQRSKLGGRDRLLLDDILDTLLWRVYIARKRKPDPVLLESLRDVARRDGRTTLADTTGICALSVAIACDCLGRMAKHNRLLRILHLHIAPAIFRHYGGPEQSSVYSTPMWALAALTGDGVDPDRVDVLEKVFNKASPERRAVFLAKLLRAASTRPGDHQEPDGGGAEDETKSAGGSDTGSGPSSSSTKSSLTGDEDGSDCSSSVSSASSLGGLELEFNFEEDSMQLALKTMEGPPVGMIEMLFRSFDLSDINDGLKHFTVLPRVGQTLQRKSLLDFGENRPTRCERKASVISLLEDLADELAEDGAAKKEETDATGKAPESNPPGEGTTPAEQKHRVTNFLNNSKLLESAQENRNLRHRLIRSLLVTEDDESILGSLLVLVLDQITHAECSEELYDEVLGSNVVAIRIFRRKLREQIDREEVNVYPFNHLSSQSSQLAGMGASFQTHGPLSSMGSFRTLNSFRAQPDQSDSDPSIRKRSSFASGMMSKSVKRTRSIKDARAVLNDIQREQHAFGLDEMPPSWQLFMSTFNGVAEEDAQQTHVLELVIMDIYVTLITTERARFKAGSMRQENRLDLSNESRLARYTLEYFLRRHSARTEAQENFARFLDDLRGAQVSNRWVNAFRTMCGVQMEPGTCMAAMESVSQTFLVALELVMPSLPGYIDTTGHSDSNLPALEVEACVAAMKRMQVYFSHLELQRAKDVFEKQRVLDKTCSATEISVQTYLDQVFVDAFANAKRFQESLRSVFNDFGLKDADAEYDIEKFESLVNCGLERVHRRPRQDASLEDYYFAVQTLPLRLDAVIFSTVVHQYARPGPAKVAFDTHVRFAQGREEN